MANTVVAVGPGAMERRAVSRLGSIRWRRGIVRVAAVAVVAFLLNGVLGAIAVADTGASVGNISTTDGVSWTNVRDSAGVPLADYLFATNQGSVLHPVNTVLSVVLGLEFTGFMVIVVTVIWLIGFALEFRWLNMFDQALTAVGNALTHQLATPIVLAISTTIGAFIVAWFVLRGYHAKAAIQIVTMLAVAVLSVTYLAAPLADVLSPNGVVAQGRNFGVAVAAGLNGDTDTNPATVVDSMQSVLADNFARHPLQVWNFGHVLDDVSPQCGAMWSQAVQAGSNATVLHTLADCGDQIAYAKADNPSIGQVGTGLVLLLFATILLLFGAYLAIKLVGAALDAVYHAFMAIFGFAAGGFIYGPTQTYLIRNLVDTATQALKMVAYTIFLGIYVLFLGDLFAWSHGQGIMVMFVAGIVEIVGLVQFRRLDASLDRGMAAITDRLAHASSPGPGPTSGMGPGHTGHTLGAGTLTKTLSVVNDSILAQQLLRTTHPLLPFARRRQHAERVGFTLTDRSSEQLRLQRLAAAEAVARISRTHGIGQRAATRTPYGVAAALQGAVDFGANRDIAAVIAGELGAPEDTIRRALMVSAFVDRARHPWMPQLVGNLNAALIVAARQRTAHDENLGEAELAAIRLHADRYRSVAPPLAPPTPGDPDGLHAAITDPVRLRAVQTEAAELRRLASGSVGQLTRVHLEQADVASLQLVRHQLAEQTYNAIEAYAAGHSANPRAPIPDTVLNLVREATRFDLAEMAQPMGPYSAI